MNNERLILEMAQVLKDVCMCLPSDIRGPDYWLSRSRSLRAALEAYELAIEPEAVETTHPCIGCGGSGYTSAACANDVPMSMRPIGLGPCSQCNGTGKGIDLATLAREKLDTAKQEKTTVCPECSASWTEFKMNDSYRIDTYKQKHDKLQAQVEELQSKAQLMEDKAKVSFGCFWNGGWYTLPNTDQVKE